MSPDGLSQVVRPLTLPVPDPLATLSCAVRCPLDRALSSRQCCAWCRDALITSGPAPKTAPTAAQEIAPGEHTFTTHATAKLSFDCCSRSSPGELILVTNSLVFCSRGAAILLVQLHTAHDWTTALTVQLRISLRFWRSSVVEGWLAKLLLLHFYGNLQQCRARGSGSALVVLDSHIQLL